MCTPCTRQDLLLLVMVESARVRHRLHHMRIVYSTQEVLSGSHRSNSYRGLPLGKRRRLREKGRGSTLGRDKGAPGLGEGNRRLGVGNSLEKGRLLRRLRGQGMGSSWRMGQQLRSRGRQSRAMGSQSWNLLLQVH